MLSFIAAAQLGFEVYANRSLTSSFLGLQVNAEKALSRMRFPLNRDHCDQERVLDSAPQRSR
jgi:hypothetical protein